MFFWSLNFLWGPGATAGTEKLLGLGSVWWAQSQGSDPTPMLPGAAHRMDPCPCQSLNEHPLVSLLLLARG